MSKELKNVNIPRIENNKQNNFSNSDKQEMKPSDEKVYNNYFSKHFKNCDYDKSKYTFQ